MHVCCRRRRRQTARSRSCGDLCFAQCCQSLSGRPSLAGHRSRKLTQPAGFSLHAARRVRADQENKLEELCRYVLCPPLASGRLRWLDADTLLLTLKRKWSDGTSHLLLGPSELIARLAALVIPDPPAPEEPAVGEGRQLEPTAARRIGGGPLAPPPPLETLGSPGSAPRTCPRASKCRARPSQFVSTALWGWRTWVLEREGTAVLAASGHQPQPRSSGFTTAPLASRSLAMAAFWLL